jgi:hypothetical protein
MGYDPNKWFNNVEVAACKSGQVGKRPSMWRTSTSTMSLTTAGGTQQRRVEAEKKAGRN